MAAHNKRPKGATRTRPAAERQQAQRNQKRAAQSRNSGAQKHNLSALDQLKSWLANHLGVAGSAYHRLWISPLATLMTLAVLAISMALPGVLLSGLKNLEGISASWGAEPRISLYLINAVNDELAETFSQELLSRNDLVSVELVSKDEGLRQFSAATGFDDILDYLGGNPLPHVIVVLPKDQSQAGLEKLQRELVELPTVEEASLDLDWVQRLAAFILLMQRSVWVLGGLLGLTVLLVVGNTIRLLIENRKQEIVVAKLVGATDAWVRRPFLYTGFWLGLLGGVIGWVLVQASLLLLQQPINHLMSLYESSYQITGLGFIGSVLLVFVSALLGLSGAGIAVGRHLKDIEPR